MIPQWQPVESTRITHEAYDPDNERILVRFPNGVEWCYEACPPDVWRAFTAPGQSRGQFIARVLDHKPHHRFDG
ncbi:MAG: KTSC domain-containing protein [Chloroflexota bacterium]|nr:KTSC domain-containing protein [Chloroflexota bacterium]MDE2841599.1 KTSC domain-containing protein [Chloroflexota bacterium]MDE2931025.1 KTSC domain-containing protein [Chloroflexota bacterium]